MAYTYQELHGKTIDELREIAKSVENHDAVQGYSQMNKQHLLPALCKALGIDTREHHVGIRGDIRYFHSFQILDLANLPPGLQFGETKLNYGRASGAFVFKF